MGPSTTESSIVAESSDTLSGARVVTVDVTYTLTAPTVTGSDAAAETTGSATHQEGSLTTQGTSGQTGGGGLSTKDRNIVIGVVVGVGGFLMLLGVGFVVWRLFLRKDNGKISGGPGKKRHSSPLFFFSKERSSSDSPKSNANARASEDADSDVDVFRANIDQYHAPRPNAASNF